MSDAASTARPRDLLADPEFLALASVQFARGLAFATILIALALYVDLFSASGVVAGLFGAAYAVVRLFLVLPIGRLVDGGNSKRYLLLGLSLYGLVLVGFTAVGAVEHVVLLRALQGLSSIVLIITGTAIVGEIAPAGDRGLWLGTYNQARALSSLAGDLVGGFLLYRYGFGATYAVLIGVTVVATVAVFAWLRDDPGRRAPADDRSGVETLRELLRRDAIRALVAFRFTFSFGKMAVVLFLPIYARTSFGMSALLIGGILAGGKLTKALAQGYVGTVSDRVGHLSWFIVAGTLLYAAGTAAIPFADAAVGIAPLSLGAFGRSAAVGAPALVLFGAYVVLGLADSLRLPPSMTLFVAEGEHSGAVAGSLSLRSVSWQVGAIVGPLAAGSVLDAVSFAAAFWLASGFMVASALAFALLYDADPAAAAAPGPEEA